MARKDIAKDGKKTRFSKERQPKNRGRKPNKFNHLKAQFQLSSEDVNAIIGSQLGMTMAQLEAVIKGKKSTIIEISFAMALYQSIKRGDLSSIDFMLRRMFGKDDGGTDIPEESNNRLIEIFKQESLETMKITTVTVEQTAIKKPKRKLINITPEE